MYRDMKRREGRGRGRQPFPHHRSTTALASYVRVSYRTNKEALQMPFYELALLGRVEDELAQKIRAEIEARVHELGLDLGDQVSLHVGPASEFHPSGSRCAAALCLSPGAGDEHSLKVLMRQGIPLIPVASSKRSFDTELPGFLRELNGLAVDEEGPSGLVLALLE